MDEGLQTRYRGDADALPARVDLPRILTREHFAIEQKKIFRRAWLSIGHTDQLPRQGSYFVFDVPTFNTSLLVIRGNDDRVRAFHNVCRHRGNKLVREGQGCKPSFMCNFHGWTYTPEGSLAVITDEHQFEDVDKAELGLVPVTTEVWENMIFVTLAPEPRETLREWLGEFYTQYGNGYFEWHELVARQQFVLDCNWHLGVNSFTEGYHTLYLHKDTARDYQGGKGNPQRHRPSMEFYRRHHRYSAPGNPDHRILPAEAKAIQYGRKLLPAFDFDFTNLPPGVNPTRYEKWGFDVVEFFPNFVMLTGNHWRAELWFWPIDQGHTLVDNRAYNYKTKNLGERISRGYFRSRGRDVVREDLNTLEAQQEMLSSGALTEIVLSRQEMALRHHYKVMNDMLAEG